MKKEVYYNDPTDDYETVNEISVEDRYYQHLIEFEAPDEITEYVTYLERQLKSKNNALKELHSELENNDKLTYYKNRIWKILKL